MKRPLRIALFVLGATVFAYLVARIGVGQLLSDAGRTGFMFLPIVLLYALVYACSALAWQLTMGESNRPPFLRTYAVQISASALNFLTPLINAGGEPFRAAAVAPWLGIRRATGSVILHRMLHSFAYVLVWFTGQREQGLAFTRFVGEVTSLGLVLVGAWVGLTSQNWTLALILAVTGWGAREAEEKGKELNILHTGLSEIRARDLMEETLPQDSVSADASVAEMVLSHPYYASDRPIAVMKNGAASPEGSELVGVITLSKTDDLLQGTWTTTPVTSLMEPPAEVEHFESDTPLTEVIQRIEALGSNPDDLPAVPVIDDGKLVGSIDPSRLAAFEQAEVELGAAEAPIPEASTGFFYRFKRIALAVAVVALLAIVGNAMISSDPYSFRNLQRTASDVPFTITQTIPLADTVASLNGDGTLSIYALAITAQPVTTASLTLDGNPLDLTMASVSPLQQGISASATEVKDGLHTIVLVVVDRVGRMARTQWQFSTGEIGKSTSQN